jgi:hypothetical protein
MSVTLAGITLRQPSPGVCSGESALRDIFVVIKEKEAELEKLKTQIIALRYVAPLLFEEGKDDAAKKPTPSPPPSGITAATMASAAGAGTSPTVAPGTTTKPAVRGWP